MSIPRSPETCFTKILMHRFRVPLIVLGSCLEIFQIFSKTWWGQKLTTQLLTALRRDFQKNSSHDPKNNRWHTESVLQKVFNASLRSTGGTHSVENLKPEHSTKGCIQKMMELVEAAASRAQRIKQNGKGGRCYPCIKEQSQFWIDLPNGQPGSQCSRVAYEVLFLVFSCGAPTTTFSHTKLEIWSSLQ